jgi:hypothetical protein
MIREENSHLRKTIEEREKQLTDLEDLRRMGRQQRRELQEAQAMLTLTRPNMSLDQWFSTFFT